MWGTYKTFIALDLAGAVARGEKFANLLCKRQGGVLILAPEGSAEMAPRLEALKRKHLLHRGPVPLAYLPSCPPFVAKQGEFSLKDFAVAINARMQERYNGPLVLIIIDTLAAA